MSTEQHHPAASGETPNTITATTVTTGCVECRTRRLYCETNVANPREACASCVRTGYICSNLTAVTHATAKKPRLPRNFRVQKDKIRINTACNWCRRQKIRCSGDKPCGACAIRDQSCIYPLAQRPSADANSSVDLASLSPATTYQRSGRRPAQPLFNEAYYLGLDKELIAEYIEAFFRFVYPVGCMSFLHQPTFLREWHTQTINLSLLKVVCACALRSASEEDSERAAQWMREAELDALQNLGHLSIPRLQALTLLAFFDFTYHAHSKKAIMLLGLAVRLALAKRLNYEDDTLSIVEQESRRRLMWSIFILDKFCSGGVAEMTLLPAKHMQIRLPSIEKAFGHGQKTDTQVLRPISEDGLPIPNATGMDEFAYTIRFLDLLRNKIHPFAKRVSSSNQGLHLAAPELHSLDADIDKIEQQIPPDLGWHITNLQKRIYSPGLSSYIMLHTWRIQCKLDLHRVTVSGIKDCISDVALQNTPSDYAENLRLQCLSYAIEMTKMWAEVLNLGLAKSVHDPAIAGCAHQCAKILTLIPEQSGFMAPSQGNRVSVVLVCQMILEPLKDIYPKAKILHDDVCRMRSEFNGDQAQGSGSIVSHNLNGQDLRVAGQASDVQVRSLLDQYRG